MNKHKHVHVFIRIRYTTHHGGVWKCTSCETLANHDPRRDRPVSFGVTTTFYREALGTFAKKNKL